MTKKFTFLLMALLALAGFRSWGNSVVSLPNEITDGERYDITVDNQTPDNWTFSVSQNSQQAGYSVQITYRPASGYENYVAHITCVNNTTGGNVYVGSFDEIAGTYYGEFTMPASSVTLTASFEAPVTYNVYQAQLTGGSIYVTPSTGLTAGTMVYVYVYPDTQNHYTFDAANYQDKISVEYGDGLHVQVSAYNNYYFFTMPAADVTVNVIFDEEPNHDIIKNEPEGCHITVTSYLDKYYTGSNVYISYSMDPGYRFNSWDVSYDDNYHSGLQHPTIYNNPSLGDYFVMPDFDVTITANVTQVTTHTITVMQPAVGGTISVSTTEAATGDPVYIDTYPAQGYTLNKWYVKNENGDVVIEDVTLGFYMPDYNVTVTADFVLAPQDLTVNEGTATNQTIPTTTAQTWYSTKSQFIIPYDQLESMFDGTITDLTFYADFNSFDFGDARWNVYVKEVDYQTLNDYVSTEGMTLVYNGGMAITNGQMHIDFDTDFQYSDNNLLVYFEQVQAGSCTDKWQNWYGVNTTKATAYAGYDYGSGQWDKYHYAQWFLPRTTFRYIPSTNPQTRYEIAINNPEGTTITASKALATEGTVITLTKALQEGYVFNNWVVMQGETPVTVENDQFEMPAGAVTVTADVTVPTYYNVYLDPSTEYTIYADPVEHILAGKTITLSDAAESGKTVDTWTVTEHTSGATVEVTFNDNHNCYQFTMPEDDVDVTATFRDLKECTINFYVNGVKWEEGTENVLEDEWVYLYGIRPETIPAGTTFTGWATSEIETYQTTYPEDLKYSFRVKDNMDLYAVFGFTEKIPTGESTWSQLNEISQLEDGDEVLFAGYHYDQSTYTGYYYLLSQRSSATATDFGRTDGMSWNDLHLGNFPEEPIVFTAVNNAGSWNFMYEDAFVEGTSALAVNIYGSMGPKSYLGGYDNWSVYCFDYPWTYGEIYNEDTHNYINFDYDDSRFYGGEYNYNEASLYRRVIQTDDHNYYMTNVLGFGGADEHIALNTEATNVVIAKNAKLTVDNGFILNVEGICLSASHDAAQLVIADGGQLVHHNTGTMATFEKNIIGYTGDNDHYYLIANPTDETVVVNLTSNEFDLYTFDGAQEVEWRNAKEDDNFEVERGTGYLYANSETVTLEFAGELTPAGSTDVDLIYDGIDFPGFNLIGNPFACNATISGTGLRSSNYYYMMNAGGTALDVVVNPILAPCTGVFAVAANSDATVTFTQANTNGIDVTRSEKNAVQDIRVELLANGKAIDRAYLNMNGESLPKFRLQDNISEICFYQDKEELAVVSTSSTSGEIPVSFKAEKNGSYTINVNTENVNAHYIHLIDNMTGMDTDLLSTSSYTFNASTSDYAYRFKLVFSMTGVENNQSNANSFAYISNGNLVIDNIEGEATMQIVDMLGRVVSTEIVSGSYNKALNLKAGLYIINLNGMTQKIVVK